MVTYNVIIENKSTIGENLYLKEKYLIDDTYGDLCDENNDYVVTNNSVEIAQFNEKMKKQGFEGIMVKRVDSQYIPGRTGWRWVKMKEAEDSLAKLVDTVDAVVMGYSAGRGKRARFGLGQFLVGVVNGDKIVTTTKVGTGLTDEQFVEIEKLLRKSVVDEKPNIYDIHKNYTPDYWVKPGVVVEIAADEITKSPTHTSGYALRFPRLVKVRNDKSYKQATTVRELHKLYKLQ